MRIAVVGAGGVGGLLGALLARAGSEVSFVARGAQLAALRSAGLQVEGTVGNFGTGPLRAAEDPGALGAQDAVLCAVKTWQVASVAESLRGLGGFVVPLQNGLEAHDRLAAVLGEERVVGGLCHMFSQIERPGVIRQSGLQPSVTVGEWKGGGSPRLEALRAELERAGVAARIAPAVQAEVWEKALFVEALGAVGAAVHLPVGRWRSVPEARAIVVGAMSETRAVARAHGVELPESAIERALQRIDGLPPEGTTSMQRDLAAGRPSELDDQTGAIVRLADRRAVPVPVHRFLLGCLLPHARAG